MAQLRRIRDGEGRKLRAIRLAALAQDPGAFSSTLEREFAYGAAQWSDRASAAASGFEVGTFVAEGVDGAADWLGLVTLLGPAHEATRPGPIAELVSVWIAPAARGQGLAAHLVQAAVDFAGTTEATAVELSVAPANDAALALYERCGFVRVENNLPAEHPCGDGQRLRFCL